MNYANIMVCIYDLKTLRHKELALMVPLENCAFVPSVPSSSIHLLIVLRLELRVAREGRARKTSIAAELRFTIYTKAIFESF